MEYIYLIAAFNAFFFTVLIWQKKPRAFRDKILVCWLLYLGAYTGCYAFFSSTLFTLHPILAAAFISLFLLHGPFMYLYASALVTEKSRLTRKELLHFVPFLIFNTYLAIASQIPSLVKGVNMMYVDNQTEPSAFLLFFLTITALSGPVYFLQTIMLLRKHNVNIFNNFSNTEEIDLYWLRKLVLIFGIVWSALLVVVIIHHGFYLFSSTFCTNGLFLLLSVFIILIGYFGLKQRTIFAQTMPPTLPETAEQTVKYAGSSLKQEEAEAFAEKIRLFMQSDKPFLNPDLTLGELSDALAIPAHHLSQVINEVFGLNFFNFVNRYRVDEVKQKILNPKYDNYSVLGIALECGFNSKTAFNRIFKHMTGLTPTEYKKTHNSQSISL